MTLEKEEELRSAGNLFQEPDSTLLLSGGMGRHWPDARGIFHNNDKNLFVWVNEGKISKFQIFKILNFKKFSKFHFRGSNENCLNGKG